jgi:formamidopyrimidine-DNA glycosylase
MPELPEVETIARGLDDRVRGDVIESVWIGSKPQPLKSSAARIVSALESARIARVHRVGKHIVLDLEPGPSARSSKKPRKEALNPKFVISSGPESPVPGQFCAVEKSASAAGLNRKSLRPASKSASRKAGFALRGESACPEPNGQGLAPTPGAQWIVHLGMTGRMVVCNPDQAIEKHTHAIARLASGWEVRFVDARRFGRLSVTQGFRAPGSEPLEIDAKRFVSLFRGRKTPIKSALLNQKLLSGVGNIYADESLFRAGIRPRRRAASLTRENLRRLHGAVQEVLKEAISLGGSSVSDYVDADGGEGFFQLQHRVYGREGEPCLVCKTPVKRVVIAGRSSHYCPKCQR